MKILTKILACLLVLTAMAFALAACKDKQDKIPNKDPVSVGGDGYKDKQDKIPNKDPVSVGGDGYSITYYERLDPSAASRNEEVKEWLDKCVNDEERNDIGCYVLFYEDTSTEKPTYTYLIYRTLLENDCTVKFYMNEDEYIITAEYTPLTTNKNNTHLSMVQVIADEEPADIDLIENGDYIGVLFTKKYTNISDFIE